MIIFEDELLHYGTKRHSGRYPWGSGDEPYQSASGFLQRIEDLRKKGFSESDIAKVGGYRTVGELRRQKTIARHEQTAANQAMAARLKDKGLSNQAIGDRMGGLNESSVRQLLDPSRRQRNDILQNTSDMLEKSVAEKRFIDIGTGVESQIGVSAVSLKSAVQNLVNQGYQTYDVYQKQAGTGKYTIIKVLGPPDSTYKEVASDKSLIKSVTDYTENKGRTFLGLQPIQNISSKEVMIRYAEEGGKLKDGVIELRRGVDNLDMGPARYAQVRIGVDGTHYLKGMAVYADDLPDGVNIRFNTNKSSSKSMQDVLKPMKMDQNGNVDPDNPFGASIKPGGQRGALNIVNEEGDWTNWSRTLSTQVLSKQDPAIAKRQLKLTYDDKKEEFDRINALTNPTVKKTLMASFADDCDSSAVHLEAAGMPRQATHAILPLTKIKPTEIYAPQYDDGDRVVLIRYPHAGRFEIPELTVNNRSREARSMLENAIDAVGIHPKVAERLSGADFDGDTVLVIPNRKGHIKSDPAVKELVDFDTRAAYPGYPGMPKVTEKVKNAQMGRVSNLITDMTIRGASLDEIVRAEKHAMVVIDSEKHQLNYKQSEIDNGIPALKAKYQGGPNAGASTLISRATSEERVPERNNRVLTDPVTGRKVYTPTNATYTRATYMDPSTGRVVKVKSRKEAEELGLVVKSEKVITRLETTPGKLANRDNAYELSSGTVIESVYADHSNALKALANQARLSVLNTPRLEYSPSAKATYAEQVKSLQDKLLQAQRNAPRERQAQSLAESIVRAKKEARPDMDSATEKKIASQALVEARYRLGAKKELIDISLPEWDAIQAGAISDSRLSLILANTDIDRVRVLATPRATSSGLSASQLSRAKSMNSIGYTLAEIANALGVSASTISKSIK